MRNNFYVYEWFNVDTNEVFYVGKGTKKRYKDLSQRNKYFMNYYNKYNCDVRIVKDNLKEDESFEIEKELIKQYRDIGQCKCNLTNGGEGCTYPVGSWHYYFQKLQYLERWKMFEIMENEDDYKIENLKTKTKEELITLHQDYRDTIDGIKFFNSLDVYDRNGNLNVGWECFED